MVGYPPCPRLDTFREFIRVKYQMDVVIGTHPIPQNYYLVHQRLGTWRTPGAQERISQVLTDEQTRLAYD